tara:strand:+ start:128 stop:319 length:192 start_codon:yes stop_codon:yes gene_type:complete
MTSLIDKRLYKDFTDDKEKMVDFMILSKEDFLNSYSYLSEEEWILTYNKIVQITDRMRKIKNV